VTSRLFGSLPQVRFPAQSSPDPGKAFAQVDQLLDSATNGPLWLQDQRIATIVANALEQGKKEYRLYELFAWVVPQI
jgi:hypothetical protein